MGLSIKHGSENYCAQVINLPAKVPVAGLDNLVQVTHQGNSCLVGKDSDPDIKYLFFPAGTELAATYMHFNNLFRHAENNVDQEKAGFFEDNGRVKAIKFKGVISTGFIIPLESILGLDPDIDLGQFKVGDSFTSLSSKEGIMDLCWKYIVPSRTPGAPGSKTPSKKATDQVKYFPEHTDTGHLLKNVHTLNLNDHIVVTHKLHGTSIRVANTVVYRQLSWKEKLAKKLGVKVQEEEHAYIVGSRRVIKSKNYGPLDNKNHYYSQDIWTEVAEQAIAYNLIKGEAIYGEVIGTYMGAPIQKGYSYGSGIPKLYIYRITHINSQGFEVDLSWEQVKQRAAQLGVETVPELYVGTLSNFIGTYIGLDSKIAGDWWDDGSDIGGVLEDIFYNKLLEKPSVLDGKTLEEGFVVRKDTYPKATALKIKSRQFLMHESKMQDQEVVDIESEEAVNETI